MFASRETMASIELRRDQIDASYSSCQRDPIFVRDIDFPTVTPLCNDVNLVSEATSISYKEGYIRVGDSTHPVYAPAK